MILFYYIYNKCKNIHSKINNGKSNRNTVIVVKQVFSLAKTIVVDVIVIYIPRIPVVFFVMGNYCYISTIILFSGYYVFFWLVLLTLALLIN